MTCQVPWDTEIEAVFVPLIPVKEDTANIYMTSLLCINGDENCLVNKKVKEQCAKPKLLYLADLFTHLLAKQVHLLVQLSCQPAQLSSGLGLFN